MSEAVKLHVTGVVQGVGFRPFIYRIAHAHHICGWVCNAVDGVDIHAEGSGEDVAQFINDIANDAPAAAHVKRIKIDDVTPEGFTQFEIRVSNTADAQATTLVSPDLATCDACVKELFDPADRRYRYPFINCTNCGPRFTIINNLPYDRKNTSMAKFTMCPACQAEYDDPLNRRFHAQPNACFECGPHISFVDNPSLGCNPPIADPTNDARVKWGNTREESDAIIARAVSMLLDGKVLAVKGLGGFHLVCDADNAEAIETLRRRKHRPHKALAVMVSNVDVARTRCFVSEGERQQLTSTARPIVLLRKRPDAPIVTGLADALSELGVMLPATPLQHLLIHDFCAKKPAGMLVMTSGNIHQCPIETDDVYAFQALGSIADAFIGNDRPIRSRYDDSVVRVLDFSGDSPDSNEAGQQAETAVQVVRRARGLAPMPIKVDLGEDEDPSQNGASAVAPRSSFNVFATGPELKNTFALTRHTSSGDEVFVSQHIGDMENAETNDAWLATKDIYEHLFKLSPDVVACDMHPEYLTSKWAHAQSLPVVEVQHHFAHIASVMAENNIKGPVAGFAFDGTGYGMDRRLWGGEILLCNQKDFERFANFAYFPLPGGTAAIKHTLRCAYGLLWSLDLLDHPAAHHIFEQLGAAADACGEMIERGLNCPQTSSVGRLFDAASALLGICSEPVYEGEGAILLEAAIDHSDAAADNEHRYHIDLIKNTATATSTAHDTSVTLFDVKSLFLTMLDDIADGVPTGYIARRFHDAMVDAILMGAQAVYALYGISTVVLAGGVFLNRYITEHAVRVLEDHGFTVALSKQLPPNDGSVSFGQSVVAYYLRNNS